MNTRFGIYIHWPFCAAKCPYCDFNSHVRDGIDQQSWTDSYCDEIRHFASITPGRTVTSVFLGGGTPSLMAPETVSAVVSQIQKSWLIANDCEITLEANPTSIEAKKFQAFRQAGVNRVSVGVQALNDSDLRFLGRKHSAAEARQALEIARENFERFSFDLIYARPEQSVARWRDELGEALSLAGGHLSLYQLTIEQGTPFYLQHHRGEFSIPQEDEAGALYEVTQEILDKARMPAYEVSNHAVAGQESVHNMTYWEYGDYVGIGPGAHGRLTLEGKKLATRGHRVPEIWQQRVQENGHGAHPFEPIDYPQRFTEALMMGLRLRQGVLLARLNEESGQSWRTFVDERRLQTMIDEGFLFLTQERLAASPAGLQRLNGVLAYLLP